MNIQGRKVKTAYFIGIKGVGMTMLAQFLTQQGVLVSGSDIPETFMTDKVLRRTGIRVFSGFQASQIQGADLIVYSIAYSKENNCEVAALGNFKKSLVLNFSQAVGAVFSSHDGIAVCGSHGKTTTSAWLGYILQKVGLNPNVLVGARVPQFNGSALSGTSKLFVAEADEYGNKLQYFSPQGVLLNNIDYDHPDYFKTKKAYLQVFIDFIKKIPPKGFLVVNVQDKQAIEVAKFCQGRVFPYALVNGKDEAEHWAQKGILVGYGATLKDGQQYFKVFGQAGLFKTKLLGAHNVANALAVIAGALALGVEISEIKKYLASFSGTARRAELLGKFNGVKIFDDYAHHPSEVQATVKAFREAYPDKKLVVFFHPHTFTRTKVLFKDFVKSFSGADFLGILEIYGSAREKQGGVSSRDLVLEIKQKNKITKQEQIVKYFKDLKEAEFYLRESLQAGDLLLLMGAGDIFRVGEALVKK
ncbi:MAG: UDP-N-acetylmuramate--L-alanine ligase [Candidatus Falkowbacteria bacterium]|nr:UDP-N-acetylmuramate--L-alanine ligase [Candidatus Falkowbacteria bacterium]